MNCTPRSFSQPRRVLRIRQPQAIQDPPGPDGQVVDVAKPLGAVPLLAPRARAVEPVNCVAKVLRPIHGPEGQTPRKELARTRHDRQHPLCARRVHNMVEPRHRVQHAHPNRACCFADHAGRRPNVVHRSPCPGVYTPVVHNDPPLPALFMLRHVLRRKGRRAPSTHASLQLPASDFLLQLGIHPSRGLTFQIVRRQLHRRTGRHCVVLDKAHRCPRRTFQPEGRRLPVKDLTDCHNIFIRQVRPLRPPIRSEAQFCDHLIAVLVREPRVHSNLFSAVRVDFQVRDNPGPILLRGQLAPLHVRYRGLLHQGLFTSLPDLGRLRAALEDLSVIFFIQGPRLARNQYIMLHAAGCG